MSFTLQLECMKDPNLKRKKIITVKPSKSKIAQLSEIFISTDIESQSTSYRLGHLLQEGFYQHRTRRQASRIRSCSAAGARLHADGSTVRDATDTGVDCKTIECRRGKGEGKVDRAFLRTVVFLLLLDETHTSISLISCLVTENCNFISSETIPKLKLNLPSTSYTQI